MRAVDKTDFHFARSTASCVLVKTMEEAIALIDSVDEAALDFETTSLIPSEGKVRLTSICNDKVHFIIDHEFLGDFYEYAPYLLGKRWFVYNAKFETTWIDSVLDQHGITDEVDVIDVDFMAKAKMGGHPSKLAWMAKRDLGVTMDKDEQNSDWANPMLTESQYNYAGFDSYITWELKKYWEKELRDETWRAQFYPYWPEAAKGDIYYAVKVFNDAVRATTEAERTGLFLDYGYHEKQVRLWEKKRDTFVRYLRRFTPEAIIANLNSDQQVGKFLERELPDELRAVWPRTEKKQQMQLEGAYLKSVARRVTYPFNRWLAALAGMKYYNKYLSTYGDTLLTKQVLEGKITARFNIGQAATGRYSSSSANLQNIPRKVVVRKAFYSPPKGNDLMALADYKGIEIRVLAELSGDKQLLHDAIYSDVHAASAAQIYNLDLDYVLEVLENKNHKLYYDLKEKRSRGKGFTFQLTYGAGAGALSDVLRCTFDEAVTAIGKWAARYPKAYGYRDKMFDVMNATGYLPVIDGRTIYVYKNERSMPVAANYPIQGAAASVMYRAMYHVRRRFNEHGLDTAIAATVHDELLSYAHRDIAEEAMTQQVAGMTDGWLDIFPGSNTDNLVEYVVGDNWSCKP